MCLVVGFTVSSCNKDNVVNPERALLKTKYWYVTVNDTIPLKTTNYQYDNYKRLERINHYVRDSDTMLVYEIFEYNTDNDNVNKYIYHYANDSIGWLLNDSTHYIYENGKLIEEVIYFPAPNAYQVSYQYEFDNLMIKRKYRYDNHQFVLCILYEYENGVCIKETRFSDRELNVIDGYTIHYHDDELLIRSEKYTSQDQNFQIILYSYDPNGTLLTEESIRTDFTVVAPIEYFYRYEYY